MLGINKNDQNTKYMNNQRKNNEDKLMIQWLQKIHTMPMSGRIDNQQAKSLTQLHHQIDVLTQRSIVKRSDNRKTEDEQSNNNLINRKNLSLEFTVTERVKIIEEVKELTLQLGESFDNYFASSLYDSRYGGTEMAILKIFC